MSILAEAPLGGIVGEINGNSYPMVLRIAEIERFEKHHDFGVFGLFDQLLDRGGSVKLTYCRDIVALSLIGGGLTERAADQVLADCPTHAALALRGLAQELLLAAFVPPDAAKKKEEPDGSSRLTDETDTTPENT
ncbi:MAG: GTA-gp10 family protein [Pseudomonadota bacterium]